MSIDSELGTTLHATTLHQRVLERGHELEGLDLALGAILKAALLVCRELIVAEVLHAIREAALDHGELHTHLRLHLHLLHQLLVHFPRVYSVNQIINFYLSHSTK